METVIRLRKEDIIAILAEHFEVDESAVNVFGSRVTQGIGPMEHDVIVVEASVQKPMEMDVSKYTEPAMMLEFWGNHDGRFNLKCRCCGYRTNDIQRSEKAAMESAVKTMACPKCKARTHQKEKQK